VLARTSLAVCLAFLPLVVAQAQAPSSTPSVKLSGYIQGRETYQKDWG
jgi:hypothetical protein